MNAASKAIINENDDSAGLLSIGTLVLWIFCLTVGMAGLALPYPRSHPLAKEPPPVQAEVIKVELTSEPLPPPEAVPPAHPNQPPPLEPKAEPPQIPPLLAVAEPSPAVAFALPVKAPARIVEPKPAAYSRPKESMVNAIMASARPPESLVFGEGEGKQPAPYYPPRAEREGQQGTVAVRFSIGENGRVVEAEAISPSPWPLLNEAALQAVRERWRFHRGPARLCEVSIRFDLSIK